MQTLGDVLTFILGVIGFFFLAYRILETWIMSRKKPVPTLPKIERSDCSNAAEQGGTSTLEHVTEQIETLTDDQLLDILSNVKTPGDDWRFAESRIGRFIGGRLEDRINQVRSIREPKRQLVIDGVRSIDFESE